MHADTSYDSSDVGVEVNLEIYNGKLFCGGFSVLYLIMMVTMPSWFSILSVLLVATQVHYWFYVWCMSAASVEVVKERYISLEFVTAPCALAICTVIGESDLIFCRGLSCCIVPFALLRNCRSRQRAITYGLVHLCSVIFNARSLEHSLDAFQWIIIAIVTYCIAFDTVHRNFALHDSRAMARSAREIFEKMLATMCDGYLVLDGDGHIIGMDKKASTFISPDVVVKRKHYDCLLSLDEAGAMHEIRPGLEKVNLMSLDGMSLEVESYTCDCVFYPSLLPLVLGTGSSSAACIGRYLRALRIVSQAPLPRNRRMGDDRAQILEPSKSARETEDGSSQGTQPLSPTLQVGVKQSQPPSSEASSVTTSHNASSLGERVDLMLQIMDQASRGMLAKSDKESSHGVMHIRRCFKRLLRDLMDQTHEQFCAFLGAVPPGFAGESIQSGVIEEDEKEVCEHAAQ
mmetsp:Transcript_70282/g.111075  ORF Transcript_70282/g.111075 Transcript_70282/m.111075 type:complete len:458 (-) Transcript_70282:61-1434(-)